MVAIYLKKGEKLQSMQKADIYTLKELPNNLNNHTILSFLHF